ncbi:MAG: type II secretion system protein, partial [Planctomycetota bacterium]
MTQQKTKSLTSHHARAAFTLIELLVVMAIIALLVGLIIVGVGAAQRRAQQVNTQFLMSSISQALARFKSDHGYYPPVLGDPSTLTSTLWRFSASTALPATKSDQVGFMRDVMLPPLNVTTATATKPVTNKVDQWDSTEAKALQDWYSVTSLAEYLIGAGDRSQDGYGICGELPDPVPTDLLPGQRELPRAGIRSPGLDGVWGAAIQPIMAPDYNSTSPTPTVGTFYTGATMGNPTTKPPTRGLFFMRNLALPTQVP